MGCFRARLPWSKTAPLKRPIKRFMILVDRFTWITIDDNRLTGTFPSFYAPELMVLVCSANMFVGTLPGKVISPYLETLGASGKAEQIRGLRGHLPKEISQASVLKELMLSHQSLEGSIPSLRATLRALVLHSNRLSLFLDAHWPSDGSALVLMHTNLLSCPLPACGGVGTAFSLAAFGNRIRQPKKSLPEWVSPMERDGLFWTSEMEGIALLFKVVAAVAFLLAMVARKIHCGLLPRVMTRWHIGPSPHIQFISTSSWLLTSLAQASLLRVFIILFAMSWDAYTCPPTLPLVSLCLRDGTFNYLLVLVLWRP